MKSEMDCPAFAALIDRAIDGELDSTARELLANHLRTCSECAGDAAFVNRLSQGGILPEPSDIELARVRRNVLATVRTESHKERDVFRWVAAAAAVVLIFAGGILIGRNSQPPQPPQPALAQATPAAQPVSSPSPHDSFASDIERVALRHQNIEDVENSPLAFSNVQVSDAGKDMVNLRFDVSRHMDLTLSRRDPVVAEVLVQSLIQPETVGTKLNVISATENLPEPKVRAALIRTMTADENVAVRLKAQEKLVQYPMTPDTEKALLQVLANDDSMQMRLVAIDYLTTHKVSPEVLRGVLAKSDEESRSALYVRAGDYIQGGNQ